MDYVNYTVTYQCISYNSLGESPPQTQVLDIQGKPSIQYLLMLSINSGITETLGALRSKYDMALVVEPLGTVLPKAHNEKNLLGASFNRGPLVLALGCRKLCYATVNRYVVQIYKYDKEPCFPSFVFSVFPLATIEWRRCLYKLALVGILRYQFII